MFFIKKLDITYDKSLVPLSTFMHILKEKKIIFIITWKQEYTESNTKSSTPHFTSNQILLVHKNYQRFKLYLF